MMYKVNYTTKRFQDPERLCFYPIIKQIETIKRVKCSMLQGSLSSSLSSLFTTDGWAGGLAQPTTEWAIQRFIYECREC